MQKEPTRYSISFKKNISMFGYFGLVIILIFIIGPIYFYFRDPSFKIDIAIIKITGLVFLIMLIPNFLIHINYLYENIFTVLEVNIFKNSLRITNRSGKYEYRFDEIIISKLYKSIYYKNEIDNANRWKTFFSDYGYWYVKFNDGEKFIFTSLMIDTENVSFIKNTIIEYTLMPLIIRDELTQNEMFEKRRNNYESNVKHYMNLFKDLTVSELKLKVNDSNSFQKEAVEACKRLLAEMSK